MEMYAVHYYGPARDIPISGLFWGALIVVALVVALILVGKAIGWLRDRRRIDGGAVEGGHTKDQFAETLAEIWHSDHRNGMASTTPHETDESLIDKTRKQRKAIKERRKGA